MINNSDPFSDIALTFSGGGFRAAGFCLGVLSYMNKVEHDGQPLLNRVKYISTVSGGTITGAAYALKAAEGKSFEAIYEEIFAFLQGRQFLDDSLRFLEDDSCWQGRRKSLIKSFSKGYDALVGDARLMDIQTSQTHIEGVTFNATEFNTGLPFRFQNEGLLGNLKIAKNDRDLEAARELVLLKDIIAASSCFPFGFEPIMFPDDFIPSHHEVYKRLKDKAHYRSGMGLMDGGIVDNQGLNAVSSAQRRRVRSSVPHNKFSLLMINDVASHYMNPWVGTEENYKRPVNHSTLESLNISRFLPAALSGKFNWLFYLLLVVLAASVAWLLPANGPVETGGIIFLSLLAGVIITFLVSKRIINRIIIKKVNSLKGKLLSKIPEFYLPLLSNFDELKIGLLERMLQERISSVFLMVTEVFLKQVRRLNYKVIYRDKKWDFMRITNTIYELTPRDLAYQYENNRFGDHSSVIRKKEKELVVQVSEEMKEVATRASNMGTTLWFEKKHEKALHDLIACGQFTTCFNLLTYLIELEHHPESPCKDLFNADAPLTLLRKRLEDDWKTFLKTPGFMLNQSR
ncbi:patatin-like phospholipase family protein [Roseivirga sp. BDSF3-8]|uniref:patatin-like phospholipase family protein n=1 Tax=Roseivirga sp. BDSF3-8 TaxID=3241598 RepID=UPI0035319858